MNKKQTKNLSTLDKIPTQCQPYIQIRTYYSGFLKSVDEHKKLRDVCTIIFHPVSRQDLCFVSENKCFCFRKNTKFWRNLWLRGLRSGDTLAKWPTVVRLPSGTWASHPEAPGSRPGLPKPQECVSPFLQGLFIPSETLPQNKGVRVPIPAVAFYAPQTPQS